MNSFLLVFIISIQFINAFIPSNRLFNSRLSSLKVVSEVGSTDEFDAALKEANGAIVVIDYSTTWCGPCKLVAPKFLTLSEQYDDVVFLKCIGDTSSEASQLMKREGVRSVPAFHVFDKSGDRIDTINGARIEEVENAIESCM